MISSFAKNGVVRGTLLYIGYLTGLILSGLFAKFVWDALNPSENASTIALLAWIVSYVLLCLLVRKIVFHFPIIKPDKAN